MFRSFILVLAVVAAHRILAAGNEDELTQSRSEYLVAVASISLLNVVINANHARIHFFFRRRFAFGWTTRAKDRNSQQNRIRDFHTPLLRGSVVNSGARISGGAPRSLPLPGHTLASVNSIGRENPNNP